MGEKNKNSQVLRCYSTEYKTMLPLQVQSTWSSHSKLLWFNPATRTTQPLTHQGMEYFRWPAWASCLPMLPPSSCTPAL